MILGNIHHVVGMPLTLRAVHALATAFQWRREE